MGQEQLDSVLVQLDRLAFAGPGAIFVSVGNRRPVSTKPQCSVCLGRLRKRNTSTSKPAMHTKCQRYLDGTGSIV